MNHLLTEERDDVLVQAHSGPGLRCESQLRVAAAMLSHTRPGEVTATTVVGVLGRDDLDAFNELVAEIGDALNLDARVRLYVGSYSVRFSRRADRG